MADETKIQPNVTEAAVQLLNEFLKLDPESTNKLFSQRFKTTKEVAKHPHIIVAGTEDKPEVGVVGLINGILDAVGADRVATMHDERDRLIGFTLYKQI